MEDLARVDQCKVEVLDSEHRREEIPGIVDKLVLSCRTGDCFDHISPEPIPSREATIGVIEKARRILYPGYFIRSRVDSINLSYYFGQEATALFEALAEQITLSIRHECLRYSQPCTHCEQRGQETAIAFMHQLPRLRSMLAMDVRAAYQGDPAAKGFDEIIFSYPGLFAISVYRVAHQLFEQAVPLLPFHRSRNRCGDRRDLRDRQPRADLPRRDSGRPVRAERRGGKPQEQKATPHHRRRRDHLLRGNSPGREHGDRRPFRDRGQCVAHRVRPCGHPGVHEKTRACLQRQVEPEKTKRVRRKR